MKKILFTLCLLFLISGTVYASGTGYIYQNTFEGVWAMGYDHAQGSNCVTNTDAHTGTHSYLMSELRNGMNYGGNKAAVKANTKFRSSVYIKGMPSEIKRVIEIRTEIYEGDTRTASIQMVEGDTDENGWTEYYYNGRTTQDGSLYVRLYISKNIACSEFNGFYFDDMTIRELPDNIYVRDFETADNSVNLRDVYAVEKKGGEVHQLDSIFDEATVSESSANVYIDDNLNVVFTGSSEEKVKITLSFYGVKATFYITFKTPIKIAQDSNGILVSNSGDRKEIEYIVLAYDKNNVYKCELKSAIVEKNSTVRLDTSIGNVPYFVSEPVKKVLIDRKVFSMDWND